MYFVAKDRKIIFWFTVVWLVVTGLIAYRISIENRPVFFIFLSISRNINLIFSCIFTEKFYRKETVLIQTPKQNTKLHVR